MSWTCCSSLDFERAGFTAGCTREASPAKKRPATTAAIPKRFLREEVMVSPQEDGNDLRISASAAREYYFTVGAVKAGKGPGKDLQ